MMIMELRLCPCQHGRTSWHWMSGRQGVGATCTYGRRQVVFVAIDRDVTDVTDVTESVTNRIVNY